MTALARPRDSMTMRCLPCATSLTRLDKFERASASPIRFMYETYINAIWQAMNLIGAVPPHCGVAKSASSG